MIQGKRVMLRPFRLDDLPALRRWFTDGEVMQYWGQRQPVAPERQFEADFAAGGRFTVFKDQGCFCICDENGRAIGYLDYSGYAQGQPHRQAELGILIGEKDAWSRGYGSQAIVLLLNWLFNHQGLHRVTLTVQARNARAQRAYEKVGFIREGTLRQHYFYDGVWNDEHQYGYLVDEFNSRYRPDLTNWVVSGEIPA